MNEVVIVAAGRTAIGSFGGSLAGLSAPELGSQVIKALLAKTGIAPDQVSEVIFGNVLTAGLGQNPARQALIKAGIPVSVPAMTINQVCGSGLKTTHLAAQAIALGDSDIVIAGGQENMSATPHILNNSRNGIRMGNGTLVDSMVYDGLTDVYNQYHMGVTAENIAAKYGISRAEQDEFSVASQNKAEAAQKAGKFDDEIIDIAIPQRKGDPVIFNKDEYIKLGATLDGLQKLKPAFNKEGTVTAGNASGINDGAAAVVMMSAKKAAELGLKPLAYVKAYASAGVDPTIMGMGPVPATQRCLARAGWSLNDLDLIEANEAFAAQACAVAKELGMDNEKVNPNGSGISLGHPVGGTGAILVTKAIYELQRTGGRYALITMCIGGGQGIALIIERV